MIDVHALSGAYAIDALDDDERASFEDHLDACPDCRAEVASLREAGAALSTVSQTAPPPELRARVLADIATVRPLPPVVSSLTERRERRSRRLPALAAAAAVIAAIGVGGIVWSSLDDNGNDVPRADTPTTPTATPSLDAVDTVLAAPDAERYRRDLDGGGSVTAVRSRELGQVAVITKGMKTLSRAQTYEAWLRLDGEMVPAGLMSGADGALVLEGDATDAEAIGITVEAAGGSPKGVPTTQPVLYLALDEV